MIIFVVSKTIDMETLEKVKSYSDNLKDSLARLYRFIDKFKDVSDVNRPHLEFINFTVEGVIAGYNSINPLGISKKYAQKFMDNLEHIKVLVDEQPTRKLEVTYFSTIFNREFKRVDTFRGYDKDAMNYQINLADRERNQYDRNDFKMIEIN